MSWGWAASCGPGDLDRIFNRLCPRVGEERLAGTTDGYDTIEPFAEGDVGLIGTDKGREVDHAIGLSLDRGAHLGGAVAYSEGTDPTDEVEQAISINIGDEGPMGLSNGNWRGATQTGSYSRLTAGQQFSRSGTGDLGT